MRRLAGIVLCALLLSACGGTTDGGPRSQPAVVVEPTSNVPTAAQLDYRKQLLAEVENGTYGACGCTAALRAKERIASGKVKAPPPDRLVANLP